jgi:hypothetical protein
MHIQGSRSRACRVRRNWLRCWFSASGSIASLHGQDQGKDEVDGAELAAQPDRVVAMAGVLVQDEEFGVLQREFHEIVA